jgi:hypothetical protein
MVKTSNPGSVFGEGTRNAYTSWVRNARLVGSLFDVCDGR